MARTHQKRKGCETGGMSFLLSGWEWFRFITKGWSKKNQGREEGRLQARNRGEDKRGVGNKG